MTSKQPEPVAEERPARNPNEVVLAAVSVRSLEDLEGPRRASGVVHPNGQAVSEVPTPTEPDPLDLDHEPQYAPLSKAADTAATRVRKADAK